MIFPDPILKLFPYKLSPLPGNVDGVSGSVISGFNIGIMNNIKQDKIEKAVEALKYMTSREIQKKFLMMREALPGILNLYDDEDVCKEADCALFKSLQPIGRPTGNYNYEDYSMKFKNYIYEYLYKDEEPDVALKNVKNILKIYNISKDVGETNVGSIIFIIVIVLSSIMFISLIFPFMENYYPFFQFLSNDLWILTVFGSIAILLIIRTYIGEVTVEKCHLGILLLSLGFSFIYIPILYKLIVNFPESNFFSSWVKKRKYIFILSFIIVDLALNGLMLINKYQVKDIMINRGHNFQICKINSLFNYILLYILVLTKIIIMFLILLLIFVEWNINTTIYDLRFVVSTIYINIISIILYIIFENVMIKNYISYFLIKSVIIILFASSNYIFIYGYRLIIAFFNKKDTKIQFIKNINDQFINSMSVSQSMKSTQYDTDANITSSSTNASSNKTDSKSTIFSKLISYHYATETYYTGFKSTVKEDAANTFKTFSNTNEKY